jgi:hypothetical protein
MRTERLVGRLVFPLTCFGVVVASSTAAVLPLPSTGVDPSGNVLPGRAGDPHYTVRGPGLSFGVPAVVYSSPNVFSGWVPDDPHSAWIGFPDSSDSSPHGDYTYELLFDLSGYNPSSASLSGNWAADQFGHIVLNGADTGVSVPDGNWDGGSHPDLIPFSITSGFKAGTNALDFVVNEPDGFDGLRVRGLSLSIQPLFLPADFNDSGKVDFADLLILAQNYGAKTGAVHGTGDANLDGGVNFADLLILAQEYGQGSGGQAAPSPVPEPSTAIALMPMAALLGRRRAPDSPHAPGTVSGG